MADDALPPVSIGELLGEHRELPADDDAMFTVDEIATTNTVLRGARLMIEDRLGEEAARPLADILRMAQSTLLTAVLEDDLNDGALLEGMARMLGERLGLVNQDDDLLGGLPYGESLRA
jgi:hypothetical protein